MIFLLCFVTSFHFIVMSAKQPNDQSIRNNNNNYKIIRELRMASGTTKVSVAFSKRGTTTREQKKNNR